MTVNHVPQLVEALQRGNQALFVGPDLPQADTGLPGRADLAARLAGRLGLAGPPPPWPEVAAQYEAGAGLNALIRWHREQLETAGRQPGPIYARLAQLPVTTYITTAHDTRLYDALRAAGRRPNLPVVDASSLGLLETGRPTVVHLFGTCDRPDSLVLTATQVRQLPQGKAQILSGVVQPTLANKSVLIVGQDLRDTYFQTLYQSALFQAATIRPMALAAWQGLADWEKQNWLQQQVRVLDVPAMDLLGELLPHISSTMPAPLAASGPRETAGQPAAGALPPEPSRAAPPSASDRTVYEIHIQNAQSLAIGNGARAVVHAASDAGHTGTGSPTAQPETSPPVAGGPNRTVTWLHLSDLHFREENSYDENLVLKALLKDVKSRIQEDGLRPDWIAITGDLAFAGKPAEYRLAGQFLDHLLRITGLPRDRLFLVPGNHDVDRGRISRGAVGIGASLTDRKSTNEVLATPADRKLMLARFEGYAAFANAYLGKELPFDDEHYFYVRSLDLGGCQVALLGLNSAWLARGGEEDRGCLVLGERQARAALEQAESAHLRIALLHHPFAWLRDFDQADSATLLTDACDFILHGHMHQVGLLQARGPDSNAFIIAAGACYESREHPNAYNLVRLDLGAGQGTVHLRAYSDRRGGFWTKDVMNYRNVPDGVYAFTLPTRPAGRA